MTPVTGGAFPDREAAVAGVHDSWVGATRAFLTAGVYPVETGVPGVRLDRAAHSMLRELHQRGPRRLGELAEATNLGVSHASRLIESLAREGLVERTVPAGDRRVTILAVTPGGAKAAMRIEDQFLELMARHLGGFAEAEVQAFAELFKRFADALIDWAGAGDPAAEDRRPGAPGRRPATSGPAGT